MKLTAAITETALARNLSDRRTEKAAVPVPGPLALKLHGAARVYGRLQAPEREAGLSAFAAAPARSFGADLPERTSDKDRRGLNHRRGISIAPASINQVGSAGTCPAQGSYHG